MTNLEGFRKMIGALKKEEHNFFCIEPSSSRALNKEGPKLINFLPNLIGNRKNVLGALACRPIPSVPDLARARSINGSSLASVFYFLLSKVWVEPRVEDPWWSISYFCYSTVDTSTEECNFLKTIYALFKLQCAHQKFTKEMRKPLTLGPFFRQKITLELCLLKNVRGNFWQTWLSFT